MEILPKIIVLDDEAELRNMLQRFLSSQGFEVRVVENGKRWHWEVVGANRDVVACGSAQSSVKARVAALAAGLEFLASHRRPKDDDSIGIRH